jgi:hypothetical protein
MHAFHLYVALQVVTVQFPNYHGIYIEKRRIKEKMVKVKQRDSAIQGLH